MKEGTCVVLRDTRDNQQAINKLLVQYYSENWVLTHTQYVPIPIHTNNGYQDLDGCLLLFFERETITSLQTTQAVAEFLEDLRSVL